MSPITTSQWTCQQTKDWLIKIGLSQYVGLLCDSHHIDGTALLMLQEEDLRKPPLEMKILGDIKKLSFHLNQLRYEFQCSEKVRYCLNRSQITQRTARTNSSSSDSESPSHFDSHFSEHSPNGHAVGSGGGRHLLLCASCESPLHRNSNIATNLKPERWKAGLAIFYALLVSWFTALVMTLVHDRVPDMNKYPPLPDLILDNIPHIPWAFDMCEVCGMVLMVVWILVLLFHKHRFILMRRFFSIVGTIFLLRCVTMIITSLSVPGTHLDCKPRPYGTWGERLRNAYVIWSGVGLSIQGVRTCGDYMFSGHTVSLTLLNFFITEYTSRRIYWLHTFTWLCNLFGIFFILAAHEHYSIDVFVAFYISSRLFLYYHTLVNNRAHAAFRHGYDAKRTWFYFPMFSLLEQHINGRVPNEFELPLDPMDISNTCNSLVAVFQNKFKELEIMKQKKPETPVRSERKKRR